MFAPDKSLRFILAERAGELIARYPAAVPFQRDTNHPRRQAAHLASVAGSMNSCDPFRRPGTPQGVPAFVLRGKDATRQGSQVLSDALGTSYSLLWRPEKRILAASKTRHYEPIDTKGEATTRDPALRANRRTFTKMTVQDVAVRFCGLRATGWPPPCDPAVPSQLLRAAANPCHLVPSTLLQNCARPFSLVSA
jgi:hypothetical protein